MKIKHLFGLAVIAAMTASCSSNEDLGTAGPGTGTNEAGVGYATFTINLPSVSGTRADAGGAEMNEGTEDEYAVKAQLPSSSRSMVQMKALTSLLRA